MLLTLLSLHITVEEWLVSLLAPKPIPGQSNIQTNIFAGFDIKFELFWGSSFIFGRICYEGGYLKLYRGKAQVVFKDMVIN